MVECRWESNGRPVAHTVSTRTRPHSVTPRESVGTEARALQRSPTGKQTLPHSAALSRNLPHFATLCRTLLHSAALCCTLLRLEQEGWRGDAARASVRWLDGLLRPAAPSVLRGPSRTIRQTQSHSAALSRTLLHSAALCCTLLHSAALCCYLPPSVILGHSRAQSAVLMNTLRCRTKAPSESTDSATLSHIECQVGRAHLGVGVRGRVWPSVAVPRLALFTLCYSQARSAALGYTLSGYAAICPPRQLGRVQLS